MKKENPIVETTLENNLIITTTTTIERLFALNPDSLLLYLFYCLTAKRQSKAIGTTMKIRATAQYCMNGLGWGKVRFYDAKKILVENGFIEDLQRKDNKNVVIGHYIVIHYLMQSDIEVSRVIKSHRVDASTGWTHPQGGLGRRVENDDTNADDKNLNADDKNIKIHTANAVGVNDCSLKENKNNKTQTNKNTQATVFSTQEPSLLKSKVQAGNKLQTSVNNRSQNKKKTVKSTSTVQPTLLKDPILCNRNNKCEKCAKCSLVPCTEEQLWEISKLTNVPLSSVYEKHDQALSELEQGSFETKYKKDKTMFYTVRNWVAMSRDKGAYEEMTDFQRRILLDHPPKKTKTDHDIMKEALDLKIL